MAAPHRILLAVSLAIGFLACKEPEQPPAERTSSPPPTPQKPAPAPPKSWSVTITTGGGFAGNGQGGVTVSSDGPVRASRVMSAWCGSIDLGEDRQAIERAVAEARAELWTRSYNSANERLICCDHFSYSVEFRRDDEKWGEVVYRTGWQGGTGSFPQDLKTLFSSVWQLRERALANCGE